MKYSLASWTQARCGPSTSNGSALCRFQPSPEVRTLKAVTKHSRLQTHSCLRCPAHMDTVYMSRGNHASSHTILNLTSSGSASGSPNLLTCWVPFGENPTEMGSLAILEGSHTAAEFERLRETYGKMDHERDHLDGSGWFTEAHTACI